MDGTPSPHLDFTTSSRESLSVLLGVFAWLMVESDKPGVRAWQAERGP